MHLLYCLHLTGSDYRKVAFVNSLPLEKLARMNSNPVLCFCFLYRRKSSEPKPSNILDRYFVFQFIFNGEHLFKYVGLEVHSTALAQRTQKCCSPVFEAL